MSDLVERLRAGGLCGDYGNMMGRKAADEIERLTAESEARRLWLSVHGLISVDALLEERDRLRDERLRSATEIMALRQIIADAEHDRNCSLSYVGGETECDCWKSLVAKGEI